MRAEGGDRLILLVTIEAPDLTQAISRVPSSSTTHCHFASEERLGLDVHFRAAQHPLGRSGRGWRIAMASTQDHRVQADVMAHPSVLAQNIFGVGIDGGRSWNMYFGSDQYIGDICDGREMNGYSGLGCM
jgi:hypothetical protein